MNATPPDSGAVVLERVRDALTRYVILPSLVVADAVVLWIAATHAVPAWGHAPRMVIKAPEKRCGKSRLLDIIEALCFCPLITVNASPSAVYRAIGLAGDNPPTLLIDEADTIFGAKAGDSNEDLRGLLNAGHQRNRPALRYNASRSTVEHIATFAMAALAGIGSMPDTIEDRAVIVRMRRRTSGEHVQPYRVLHDRPPLDALRAELHTWCRASLSQLAGSSPPMPVEDRAADTWEPLVAIADLAGGPWPGRARAACLALTSNTSTEEVSLRVRLLIDCRTAFADDLAVTSAALVERLKADPEAPWGDLAGTGITVRRLASMLHDYDITSANVRFPDGTQAKGYTRDGFTDAWDRYCPPVPDDETGPEAGGGHPSQVSQASAAWSGWDGSKPWDGSTVPAPQPVAAQSAQTVPPPPAVCIICRHPMSYDDGTQTHPACDPSQPKTG